MHITEQTNKWKPSHKKMNFSFLPYNINGNSLSYGNLFLGQSAEKVYKMRRSSGRVVLNKSYKDDQSTWEKPMQLKSTGKHAEEDKGHTKQVDDSENLYENIECQKSIKPQSNRRLVWLPIVACLISIVALLLGLLMFSGEIGNRCDCSANEGQF